jgi:cyclophilin family peptidyl-prolyl cis-trans isomerase
MTSLPPPSPFPAPGSPTAAHPLPPPTSNPSPPRSTLPTDEQPIRIGLPPPALPEPAPVAARRSPRAAIIVGVVVLAVLTSLALRNARRTVSKKQSEAKTSTSAKVPSSTTSPPATPSTSAVLAVSSAPSTSPTSATETSIAGDTTPPAVASSSTGATAPSSAVPVVTNDPNVAPATVPGRTITGATPCPKADGSEPRAVSFVAAPPMCIDPSLAYVATVTTNKGVLTIVLDAVAAPKTVNNFVVLARYHFFDNTVCHRIITSFVVQCGDPGTGAGGPGTGGPGYRFEDELPAAGTYRVGSIAMANSGADSNGSQFFMITGGLGTALPPNYTLFGQVDKAQNAVIATLDAAGTETGVPTKELVFIQSVTIDERPR